MQPERQPENCHLISFIFVSCFDQRKIKAQYSKSMFSYAGYYVLLSVSSGTKVLVLGVEGDIDVFTKIKRVFNKG